MDSKSKQIIIDNLTFFKEFSEKVNSYQLVEMDVERIIYFLTQFKSAEQIKIIISLLKNIEFLDSKKITYLLKMAYEKIDYSILNRPVISTLGGIQDSSAVVCYQLLKNLFDDEKETLDSIININSLGEYILTNNPSVIILFDDNITSGTQLNDFFEELIKGKSKAEFFKKPLSDEEFKALQKIPIRICYSIQLAEKSNYIIEKIKSLYNLDVKFHTGKVDYNNYLDFQANVVNSEEESNFAKNFISEISTELYNDKEWSKETVYSRLLGYGNLGKLTVFYYNVPKSFIPIFWKFGTYDKKPWFPLFPETQEQKKIIASKKTFDYITLEAIKGWLITESDDRFPKLQFGILNDGNIQKDLIIKIPSYQFIKEQFHSKINPKKANYIENKISNNNNFFTFLNKEEPLKSVLSDIDYSKYIKAIDKYNLELDVFCEKLKNHIYKLSNTKKIDFILNNQGNKPATNFNVKIYYNTSSHSMNNFDDFCPEWETKIPNINKFYTSKIGEITLVQNPSIVIPTFVHTAKRKRLNKNSDYEYRISDSRLGHNDHFTESIDLTRIDDTLTTLELNYDLNYDEEATTIKGKISISYIEVEEIESDIEQYILEVIRDYKEILE